MSQLLCCVIGADCCSLGAVAVEHVLEVLEYLQGMLDVGSWSLLCPLNTFNACHPIRYNLPFPVLP